MFSGSENETDGVKGSYGNRAQSPFRMSEAEVDNDKGFSQTFGERKTSTIQESAMNGFGSSKPGFGNAGRDKFEENAVGSVSEREALVSEESFGFSNFVDRKDDGFGEGETGFGSSRAKSDKKEDGLRRRGDDDEDDGFRSERFSTENKDKHFGASGLGEKTFGEKEDRFGSSSFEKKEDGFEEKKEEGSGFFGFEKSEGENGTRMFGQSKDVSSELASAGGKDNSFGEKGEHFGASSFGEKRGNELGEKSFGEKEDRFGSSSFEKKEDGFQEKKERLGGFGSEVLEKMKEVNIGEKKESGFGSDGFGEKKEDAFGSSGFGEDKERVSGAIDLGEKRDGSIGEKKEGRFGTDGFGEKKESRFGSGGFGEKKESGFGSGGFGEKKGSGFGEKKESGFGSGGFGEKKEGGFGSGGFGEKKDGGFGSGGFGERKDNAYGDRRDGGSRSGGFGENRDSGFGGGRGGGPRSGGFGDRKESGFGDRREGGPRSGGFGEKRESGFGSGGFGEKKESGFGSGGFGEKKEGESRSGGYGERRDSGFGNSARENGDRSGGFGNRREGGFGSNSFGENRDSSFNNKRDNGFSGPRSGGRDGGPRSGGFGENRDSGFGGGRDGGSRSGGFGENRDGGFGGGRDGGSRSGGFRENRDGGFGGGRDGGSRSGGFGDNRDSGFGGGRGGGPRSGGFGDRKESGFGDRREGGPRSGGFGEKRESGFGSGGFGEKKESGFGSGGFGEKKEGESRSGGFGEKKESGFGSGGFGERKESGFGSSGFGEKKGSGFGEKKESGFGSGGFGEKKEGGFGSSGFGEKKENGFGSGGFGEKRDGGFGSRREGGFGGDGFGERKEGGFGSGGFGDRREGGSRSGGFGSEGFGRDSRGFSGDNNEGFGRGGSRPPMKCFKCNEEGHRAADCENGGGGFDRGENSRDFGNRSFGKGFGDSSRGFGDDSFRNGGGERSNKCFNCQEEGHRASDCTAPRKEREPRDDDDGPKASTFIPKELGEEELFNERIEKGLYFEKFFDAKVAITSGGLHGNVESIKPLESFEALNLTNRLKQNVVTAGYSKPTPIQQYAVPIIQQGRDLMACAQTGSGKTAAFLLPIMQSLIEKDDLCNSAETVCSPRCLIVAPTRELADQIYNEGKKFAWGTIMTIKRVIGGSQVQYSAKDLRGGGTILVCTPGRLLHFVQEGFISLKEVRYFVLDEADRMLDMGFGQDVSKISNGMCAKKDRQTLMFSATYPAEVHEVATSQLRDNYLMIAIDAIGAANKCITQEFINCEEKRDKLDKLLELLKVDLETYTAHRDSDVFKKKTIIFVGRKSFADTLGAMLIQANINATTIHGDRRQYQRSEAIEEFRSGKKPVLIATAVAERGLDIKGVDHVINYELPDSIEQYVHRIGRTGRLGNPGRATSLYCSEYDRPLAYELVQMLTEAEQVVPDWLQTESAGGNIGGDFTGGATDVNYDDW